MQRHFFPYNSDASYAVYFESVDCHSIYFFENNWAKSVSRGTCEPFNLLKTEQTRGFRRSSGAFLRYPIVFLDQNTVAVGSGNLVYIFNTTYNNCIQKLRGHFEPIYGMEYSRRTRGIYTVGGDAMVTQWENCKISELKNAITTTSDPQNLAAVDNWSDSE